MRAPLVAGVIGWPVDHSRSPAIHNAAAAAAGAPLVYGAMPVAPGQTESALDAVRALGLRGLSVTMPHKERAAELVDRRSEVAERLGAVNHVRNDEGVLWGDNTDGEGFLIGLEHETGSRVAGRSVAIAGTGGAARAILAACHAGGAARLGLLSRDPTRVGMLRHLAPDVIALEPAALGDYDLVINATPVGMAGTEHDGKIPFEPTGFAGSATVVDIVYNPIETPLMAASRACGLTVVGGLAMLAGQAAAQFESWTGVEAPLDVMIAAASA